MSTNNPINPVEAPEEALEVYKSMRVRETPASRLDLEREGVAPPEAPPKHQRSTRRRKALVLLIVLLLCLALAGSLLAYIL